MSDNPNLKTSEPAEEKEDSRKRNEDENPKMHGSQVHSAPNVESEAGGGSGEGRTGTKLGSTDS